MTYLPPNPPHERNLRNTIVVAIGAPGIRLQVWAACLNKGNKQSTWALGARSSYWGESVHSWWPGSRVLLFPSLCCPDLDPIKTSPWSGQLLLTSSFPVVPGTCHSSSSLTAVGFSDRPLPPFFIRGSHGSETHFVYVSLAWPQARGLGSALLSRQAELKQRWLFHVALTLLL